MTYIRKHPNSGYYHYRQAVPQSLVGIYHKREIVLSLRTKDRTQAKILANQLSVKLLTEFEQAKQAMRFKDNKPQTDTDKALWEIAQKHKAQAEQWQVNLPSGINISTDPQAKDQTAEHRQALEALKALQQDNPQPQPEKPTQPNTGVEVFGSTHKPLISCFNEYVEELEAKQLKSIDHIKPALNNFIEYIRESNSNIPVNQVKPEHIKQYKKYLRTAYNKRTKQYGLKESTIYKRIGFIDTFMKWCQDQQYIADGDRNLPTYKQKGKKPDAVSAGTTYKAFTQQEIQLIFSDALNTVLPHLQQAIYIGAYTGARLAELCYINPQDIDLNTNTIRFETATKNNSSKRIIPIHKAIIPLFSEIKQRLYAEYENPQTIFPHLTKPDKRIGDAFAKYLIALEIKTPEKVFHSFRKNVSEQLKLTGCPSNYAEYYIGHLNRNLHNSIYAGVDEPVEQFRKHINKISYIN